MHLYMINTLNLHIILERFNQSFYRCVNKKFYISYLWQWKIRSISGIYKFVQRSDWKYHCEILMCDFAFIERQTKLNCEIGVIICRCEYIVCKMKSLKQFHIILKK